MDVYIIGVRSVSGMVYRICVTLTGKYKRLTETLILRLLFLSLTHVYDKNDYLILLIVTGRSLLIQHGLTIDSK